MVCGSLVLPFVFCAAYPQAQAPTPAAEGRRYLDMLLTGKYAEFHQNCTLKMREQVTVEVLKAKVAPMLRSFGTVEKIGEPRVQLAPGARVVLIPVTFARMSLNFRITLDDSGKIAGLFFEPISQTAKYESPPYSKQSAFKERDVMFGLSDWQLPGTVSIPEGKGPFSGVVLVAGSGPADRDETIGPNKPFRDIAEGLASRGIAVLRYDKRTRQHAARVAANKELTVKEEVIDDAVEALSFLRKQSGVNSKKVFLLGHSLGGSLAPRIAARDEKVAGLIVAAAAARSIEDVIREQLDYIRSLPGQSENARMQIDGIKQSLDQLKKPDPPKDLLVMGMPAHYLLDLRGYDPAAEAAKLRIPMLVLHGERDYQTTMQDFALWRKALEGRNDVVFRSYPTLNHLFMQGVGKSVPSEYEKEGHVAPEIIDEIVRWVSER